MHLVLLAALGCNSVSGKIDEHAVSVHTAAMMEYELDGADDYIVIAMASHGMDCEEWADFNDDFWDEVTDLDFEGAEELWEEKLPEDWWQIIIRMRVDDVDDRADKVDYDPVDWDDGLSEDGDTKIFASHYTEWIDKDEYDTWGPDQDYAGDEGSLKIKSHKPGGKISGTYKTMMVDDDGDDEGQVTVRFSADHCESLEDWF